MRQILACVAALAMAALLLSCTTGSTVAEEPAPTRCHQLMGTFHQQSNELHSMPEDAYLDRATKLTEAEHTVNKIIKAACSPDFVFQHIFNHAPFVMKTEMLDHTGNPSRQAFCAMVSEHIDRTAQALSIAYKNQEAHKAHYYRAFLRLSIETHKLLDCLNEMRHA